LSKQDEGGSTPIVILSGSPWLRLAIAIAVPPAKPTVVARNINISFRGIIMVI